MTKLTTLYFIRHGETDWNVTGRWQGHHDVPLNDIGRAQARRLAARLQRDARRFTAIYSSDLLRAWETAQLIGAGLALEPQPVPALREIDLGSWSGLTRAEVAARDPELLARIDAGEDLPRGGAERTADLTRRVVAAAERLALRHPGGRLLLVSHGGAVRAMLTHILRDDADPLGWRLLIGNTAISTVTYGPQGWETTAVNDMHHLEGSTQAPDLISAPPDDAQQV